MQNIQNLPAIANKPPKIFRIFKCYSYNFHKQIRIRVIYCSARRLLSSVVFASRDLGTNIYMKKINEKVDIQSSELPLFKVSEYEAWECIHTVCYKFYATNHLEHDF